MGQNKGKQEIKQITLSKTQLLFFLSDAKFPAISGGYGSGKTEVSILRLWRLMQENPGKVFASYFPSFDLVSRIGYPRWIEFLNEMKVPHKLNKKEKVMALPNGTELVFRSMDEPENIVGYQACHSQIDELDVLPYAKANIAWKKIISRTREKTVNGKPNTVSAVSTPEGFKFMWERWYDQPMKGAELYIMPTSENAHNLPPDYIDTLRSIFPAKQLNAYLEGFFVNLTSDNVYAEFDREKNGTNAVMLPEEPVYVGVDFNVGKMCAVAHVEREVDGELCAIAVDEIVKQVDTPALIAKIKEKWDHERHIVIYPDSTGRSRSYTNASITSVEMIEDAGFRVEAHEKNPLVVDRVATWNALIFRLSDNVRRYYVNTKKCPSLTSSLEKQTYTEKGLPDKSGGFDHILDATGYYVYYRFPIAGQGMDIGDLGYD